MAKRGRKARPSLLTARPTPSRHLTKEMVEVFEDVCLDLESQDTLCTTDSKLIELYARTYVIMRRIEGELDADELTSTSERHKKMSANPLMDRYFSALKLCQLLLTKLGLSPQTRKKSTGSTDPEDSSWDL